LKPLFIWCGSKASYVVRCRSKAVSYPAAPLAWSYS
jgi:hypothetical protein